MRPWIWTPCCWRPPSSSAPWPARKGSVCCWRSPSGTFPRSPETPNGSVRSCPSSWTTPSVIRRRGVVTLRAEVDGAALTLQVADTGPGISTQSLPYIFDRFYRADVSRTTNEHFGLDLSIAKEPADLHGGDAAGGANRARGYGLCAPSAPSPGETHLNAPPCLPAALQCRKERAGFPRRAPSYAFLSVELMDGKPQAALHRF